jgi:iron complex outermembrane receptor protein
MISRRDISRILIPTCLAACTQVALAQDAGQSVSLQALGMAAAAAAASGQEQAAASPTSLDAVNVRDARRPYRNLSVTGATKTDALIRDLPQSIQIIGADLLRDAGVVDLAGALDLSSSVSRQSNLGGMWDSYAIRGFAGDPDFGSDYMVNGFNASRGYSGVRDNANIQSVEVLKGPASALYGRGEPGGTVNISTKKPLFKPAYSIEQSVGSFDTYRTGIDLTGPLSETVAYRLTGSYHESEGFRDHMDFDRRMFAPAVLWMITPDTTLSYELESVRQRQPFDRGVVMVDGKLGAVPITRFYGEPNDGPYETRSDNHQVFLSHYFNDIWSIQTGVSYRESSLGGAATEVRPYGALVNGETLRRRLRVRENDATDMSGRFEVLGRLEAGSLVHNVLFGVDAYRFDDRRFQAAGDAAGTVYGIDLLNPVYGAAKPATVPSIDTDQQQKQWAYYFQDQIEFSDKWKALVGVRRDEYTQVMDNMIQKTSAEVDLSATTWRVGAVYQPTEALSFYATTARSFRPNNGMDRNFNTFDPEEGKSYEVGMKLDSLGGRLSTTLALFDIDKVNVLTPDPIDPNQFNIAVGAARSRGAELDVSGTLREGLRLNASLAYTDATVTKDNAQYTGVSQVGQQLANVPKLAGNVLAIQEFKLGGRDASFGAGIRYVGEREGSVAPFATTDMFKLPSYTVASLVGSYKPTQKLLLSLNVDNLFDKEHYVNSYSQYWIYPGMERRYTLTARFSF